MEKQLEAMPAGQTLIVLATDPMAKIDVPLYCRQNGHSYTLTEADGELRFTITKSA